MDSISVIPFRFKHYSSIIELLPVQTPYKTLPKIGYVAIRNKKIIAIGFLRKVEGNKLGLLEIHINDYIGSVIAFKSFEMIIDMLKIEAKELKLQELIIRQPDNASILKAEAIGFHTIIQSIAVLSLKGK